MSFVAQIFLRLCFPLPQTDLAYGHRNVSTTLRPWTLSLGFFGWFCWFVYEEFGRGEECRVERLIQAGASAVGADQAVVRVDEVLCDAQFQKNLTLGRQVLFIGGAAGISNEGVFHGCTYKAGVVAWIGLRLIRKVSVSFRIL